MIRRIGKLPISQQAANSPPLQRGKNRGSPIAAFVILSDLRHRATGRLRLVPFNLYEEEVRTRRIGYRKRFNPGQIQLVLFEDS